MLRHTRAPLLAAALCTLFALAACSDPTGPAPTPAGRSASARRVGAQGGVAGGIAEGPTAGGSKRGTGGANGN